MFIDFILIGSECSRGTEGEFLTGNQIRYLVALMFHRQLDLLFFVCRVADDDHRLLLVRIFDVVHLCIERTGDPLSATEMGGLMINLHQLLQCVAGRIIRLEVHDGIVEEIYRVHVA